MERSGIAFQVQRIVMRHSLTIRNKTIFLWGLIATSSSYLTCFPGGLIL